MASKEMFALEHAQTARDFLAASDREFDAGDHRQGSEKLYGAATQAISAICRQRGWQYDNRRALRQAVVGIGREHDADIYAGLIGGFIAAERFHENFIHDHLEDYERDADRPLVHHFVNRLMALLDMGDGKAP